MLRWETLLVEHAQKQTHKVRQFVVFQFLDMPQSSQICENADETTCCGDVGGRLPKKDLC